MYDDKKSTSGAIPSIEFTFVCAFIFIIVTLLFFPLFEISQPLKLAYKF